MTEYKSNFIKHKKKIFLSTILIAVTALCLIAVMPASTSEAAVTIDVTTIDSGATIGGVSQLTSGGTAGTDSWTYNQVGALLWLRDAGPYTLTGTNTNIEVYTTTATEITLNNLTLTSTRDGSMALDMTISSGCTINLIGTNSLTGETVGIKLTTDITITSTTNGTLEVKETRPSYGTGVSIEKDNASLIINGSAKVTAKAAGETANNSKGIAFTHNGSISVGSGASLEVYDARSGILFPSDKGLTLNVDGALTIDRCFSGIDFGGVTIKGTGAVNVKGIVGMEIYYGHDLVLEGCIVSIEGTDYSALFSNVGTNTIKMEIGAKLTMKNTIATMYTFDTLAAAGTYQWQLTGGATTSDPLTNASISVLFSVGVTGTVECVGLAPAINVTSTGLGSLKVGVPVTGSVVYTLINDTYVASPTLTDFTAGGLPPGLSANTAVRTSDTVITVAIVGTPTTYSTAPLTLTYAASIPAGNMTSNTAITPTGTITASAVAKGTGAAVSGAPTVSGSPTATSITANAVTIPTNPGSQTVEYAISTTSGTTPATGWQAGTTFTPLVQNTTYYVYARSAASTNYDAGTAQQSTGILTAPGPAIAVTASGLNALKVGVPVTGSVLFTLSNDTYAAAITAGDFTVSGLPAGLTAGTAVWTSGTVVTVPITGTPTTANASSVNLTIPSSIPGGNFTGGTVVVPTGTVTASAVAKGDGAAVSGAPTVNGTPTQTSIAVNAVTVVGSQTVEYAISTTSGTTPATGWQAGTTFSSLSAGTTYYVYARSASNANYNAGPAQESAPIATAAPTPVTFTAVQTGGTSGTVNSTGIVLTFTPAVTGLTADKITITNGTGAVTKGALSNSGTTWTIALTAVATQGNVTVSVANFGAYNVTTGPLTVAVYKNNAAPPVNPPVTTTNVAFTAVQTGGSSGTATSTGIVLSFSQAVTGLAASNVTITNGTGVVTKGALTGSGTSWTIALTSVTTQGNVTVSVSSFGTFNVTGGPVTVAVYAAPAKNYGVKDGAGGSWNQGSDQGLGITVGADSSKVTGVSVDDKQVPAGSYTVGNNASGDAVVTFKAAYLETLSPGTHNVKILFADGTATTTMTVSPSDAGEGGGGSNTVLIAAGVIIVMLVIIVLVYLLVIRPKTK